MIHKRALLNDVSKEGYWGLISFVASGSLFSTNTAFQDTCKHCKLCVRLGAPNQDKVVKVQEPLPNHLIKQQQEVDS